MDESQTGLCGSENSALRGEGMSNLQEQLRKVAEFQQRERNRERINAKNERENKTVEQMSRRDWEEMMGKNRDTYRRGPGGAIRRR